MRSTRIRAAAMFVLAATVSLRAGDPNTSKSPQAAVAPDTFAYADTLLLSDGKDRKIGVSVSPADEVLRAHVPATQGKLGLVVTNVVKGSPAAKAGIQSGDLLLKLNAKSLATVKDLTVALQQAKPPVKAGLLRQGKPLELHLTLSAVQPKTSDPRLATLHVLLVSDSKYWMGVTTHGVDQSLAAQLVLPPSTGLVISSVTAGSPAAKAGLQQHDVLLSVNGNYVADRTALGKALDKAVGKTVAIEFVRAGRKQTCQLTPVRRPARQRLNFLSTTVSRRILEPYVANRIYSEERLVYGLRLHNPTTQRAAESQKLKTQVQRLTEQLEALRKSIDALSERLPKAKAK